jgi:spore coat polysaccharide biosynthesis protein SpsF
MSALVRAFVQARMSSARFPGKVLAPFRGEPVVLHVVRAAAEAVGAENVVVATSEETSDDPLAAYLASIGVVCFRGPRNDVLERFRLCARAHPSTWVLRLSADSPLLDPNVVRAVVDAVSDDVDVVTTALGSSAHGTNAELVRSSALLAIDPAEASTEEREHVMPFFYSRPERFRIRPVEVEAGGAATVDTVDDLRRLEAAP